MPAEALSLFARSRCFDCRQHMCQNLCCTGVLKVVVPLCKAASCCHCSAITVPFSCTCPPPFSVSLGGMMIVPIAGVGAIFKRLLRCCSQCLFFIISCINMLISWTAVGDVWLALARDCTTTLVELVMACLRRRSRSQAT